MQLFHILNDSKMQLFALLNQQKLISVHYDWVFYSIFSQFIPSTSDTDRSKNLKLCTMWHNSPAIYSFYQG